MKIRGKEEILFAALQLAAEKGLRAVSMSMIAEKVGMKKPSLYNHFASKEELVREKAKRDGNVSAFAAETLPDLPAEELLQTATENYLRITESAEMQTFYKVLYSERTFSEIAAQILTEETEKIPLPFGEKLSGGVAFGATALVCILLWIVAFRGAA